MECSGAVLRSEWLNEYTYTIITGHTLQFANLQGMFYVCTAGASGGVIGFAFLDDGTVLADRAVLAGYLFLRAYPLAGFIAEHAAGGDPDIRLRQQAALGKDQMDMIVRLFFCCGGAPRRIPRRTVS